MRKSFVSIICACVINIFVYGSDAQDGTWTHWTATNAMTNLVVQGDYLWIKINEGLIRYNTFDGSWKRFTTADGLPNRNVKPLLVDNSDNLWAGYYGVICRFDNSQWTVWTKEDGIPENSISCSFCDRFGNLWFGLNGGGVLRYYGEQWENWTMEFGHDYPYVVALDEDSSGNIWAGSEKGIHRFDGISWQNFYIEENIIYTISMIIDDKDNIWIGTLEDVARFDGSSWKIWTLHPDLPNRHVWCLLEDTHGNIWAGSGGGISRFDGTDWTHWTPDDGMSPRISIIHEDSRGNIWAISSYAPWGMDNESGIYMFDGSAWKHWTEEEGLASDIVYSLVEDSTGTIWAGTDDGLCYYDGVRWNTWRWLPCIYGYEVFNLLEGADGSLWVSTHKGVSKFDGFEWTKMLDYPGYDFAGPTPDGPLALDASGNVWVGLGYYENGGMCIGGMSRFDGVNWTVWTRKTPDFPYTGFVLDLMPDSSGKMWAGTERSGAIMFDGEMWTSWSDNEYPDYDRVYTLLEDDRGSIWGGSDDNIRRFDGESWIIYTIEDGLFPGPVKSLLKDGDGHIWALSHGTTINNYEGGLSRFDGEKWTKIEGLEDCYTKCMTIDKNGMIWVGSMNSVSRFDGSGWTTWSSDNGLGIGWVTSILADDKNTIWVSLRAVIDGNRRSAGGGVSRFDGVDWKTLTVADGLPSNFVKCLYNDRSGNIWVGMQGGVSRFTAGASSVEDTESMPSTLSILGIYPNPFNVRTTIKFSLSGAGFTKLVIYNNMGQAVQELIAEPLHAGHYSVVWDGRNSEGETVSSGVYFSRISQGSLHANDRMLLLK